LEVRPARLATAFKLDPWVEEVVKVSYAPGRILVDLRFREPVAWVKFDRGLQLVDGDGRLLPAEDVDLERAGRLLKITGVNLTPPADPRAGVVWKSKPKSDEAERIDEKIVAATSLARFLRQNGDSRETIAAALRMIEIIVTEFRDRGLFLLNADGIEFCWGSAPGFERPRELKAIEKWQVLLRWAEQSPSHTPADGDYWEISARGVSLVCTHKGGPHRLQPRRQSTTQG
jgi:hypothetical protein